MKKRGRPPSSAATIENRRIEEMLRNAPDFARRTDKAQASFELDDTHNENIRLKILRQYKGNDPTIPDSHAYEMASIGDESLIGCEATILAHDAKFQAKSKHNKSAGTEATHKKSLIQAAVICEKNKDLISCIRPAGRLSVNGVAKSIWFDWSKRGYGDKVTVRTLINYINTYSKK